MITALTDNVSTLALETHEKKPAKSASVELSVSYVSSDEQKFNGSIFEFIS